jgi:CO dehydrogenase maturation factor
VSRAIKLAVAGKGGSGKSTVAAALALLLARSGGRVLAVDADPDANLASALGVSRELQRRIVPISERRALIEERTGAKVRQYGQMFKMNPEVADVAETCAVEHDGVALVVLGAIEAGGSGCACPESVMIKALVADLVLHKDQALVMDMEAGIEHLGRGTARGVDTMLVVVEPSRMSVECAERVFRMAGEIGLSDVRVVANKIASPDEEAWLRQAVADRPIVAIIPFAAELRDADRNGRSVLDGAGPEAAAAFAGLLDTLREETGR